MKWTGIGTLTLLVVGFLLVGTLASVPSASAASNQVPKLVTIATLSPGSTLTIFASGISKVMNDRTKMSPRLQNFSTYVTYTPMLNTGDVDMGPSVSSEALQAWKGIKPYRKSRNIRLLMAGPDILTAYVTTKDSGMCLR